MLWLFRRYIISVVLVGIQGCTVETDKNRDTEANLKAHRHRGTQAHRHKFACTCILYTYTHSHTPIQATHTQSHPALKSVKTGGSCKTAHPFCFWSIPHLQPAKCKLRKTKEERGLLYVSERPNKGENWRHTEDAGVCSLEMRVSASTNPVWISICSRTLNTGKITLSGLMIH